MFSCYVSYVYISGKRYSVVNNVGKKPILVISGSSSDDECSDESSSDDESYDGGDFEAELNHKEKRQREVCESETVKCMMGNDKIGSVIKKSRSSSPNHITSAASETENCGAGNADYHSEVYPHNCSHMSQIFGVDLYLLLSQENPVVHPITLSQELKIEIHITDFLNDGKMSKPLKSILESIGALVTVHYGKTQIWHSCGQIALYVNHQYNTQLSNTDHPNENTIDESQTTNSQNLKLKELRRSNLCQERDHSLQLGEVEEILSTYFKCDNRNGYGYKSLADTEFEFTTFSIDSFIVQLFDKQLNFKLNTETDKNTVETVSYIVNTNDSRQTNLGHWVSVAIRMAWDSDDPGMVLC